MVKTGLEDGRGTKNCPRQVLSLSNVAQVDSGFEQWEPQVQKLSLGLFPDQIEVRKVNQLVMVWGLIRGSPESIRRLIKLCMCVCWGGGRRPISFYWCPEICYETVPIIRSITLLPHCFQIKQK